MPNIILVSENKEFSDDIMEQISLYAKEYNVHNAYDPEAIYDLVIVDDMPNVLQIIRDGGFKVPVIYFQKLSTEKLPFVSTDIIIKKPFCLDSFLDVIKSSLNVFDNNSDGNYHFNNYELIPVTREIVNRATGDIVKLTEKEVAIIKYLYKANKRIVSKNELLQEVWGYSPETTTHTIETHIYRLRNKIEKEDQENPTIMTEDGGYKLKV